MGGKPFQNNNAVNLLVLPWSCQTQSLALKMWESTVRWRDCCCSHKDDVTHWKSVMAGWCLLWSKEMSRTVSFSEFWRPHWLCSIVTQKQGGSSLSLCSTMDGTGPICPVNKIVFILHISQCISVGRWHDQKRCMNLSISKQVWTCIGMIPWKHSEQTFNEHIWPKHKLPPQQVWCLLSCQMHTTIACWEFWACFHAKSTSQQPSNTNKLSIQFLQSFLEELKMATSRSILSMLGGAASSSCPRMRSFSSFLSSFS